MIKKNSTKNGGDLKFSGIVSSSHSTSNTVRSWYSCCKAGTTLTCFKLLIIEGCGDRGIDTIINDNYDISWGSALIVVGNRSIQLKQPPWHKKCTKVIT